MPPTMRSGSFFPAIREKININIHGKAGLGMARHGKAGQGTGFKPGKGVLWN